MVKTKSNSQRVVRGGVKAKSAGKQDKSAGKANAKIETPDSPNPTLTPSRGSKRAAGAALAPRDAGVEKTPTKLPGTPKPTVLPAFKTASNVVYAPYQGDNGKLREVFKDVFVVEGLFNMAPFMHIKRTMTVLRHGGELCLINTVRLDAASEAALEKLGKIKVVMRLTGGHGLDDPYYVDKYSATLVAGPGAEWNAKHGIAPLQTQVSLRALASGGQKAAAAVFGKIQGVFEFETIGKHAATLGAAGKDKQSGEYAVLVTNGSNGTVLVTADAVQNYEMSSKDESISDLTESWLMGPITWAMGFSGRTMVAPLFINMSSPDKTIKGLQPDFERLLKLEWSHLIPGHGFLALNVAKEDLLKHLRGKSRLGPDFLLLQAGADC